MLVCTQDGREGMCLHVHRSVERTRVHVYTGWYRGHVFMCTQDGREDTCLYVHRTVERTCAYMCTQDGRENTCLHVHTGC